MRVDKLRECITVCEMFLTEAKKQLADHKRRVESGHCVWYADHLTPSAGAAGMMTALSKVLSQTLVRLRKD